LTKDIDVQAFGRTYRVHPKGANGQAISTEVQGGSQRSASGSTYRRSAYWRLVQSQLSPARRAEIVRLAEAAESKMAVAQERALEVVAFMAVVAARSPAEWGDLSDAELAATIVERFEQVRRHCGLSVPVLCPDGRSQGEDGNPQVTDSKMVGPSGLEPLTSTVSR
jgi:hypothetical protein